MPGYLIASADELLSCQQIRHFDVHARELLISKNWLPETLPARIAVTSGASCPDILMNQVIEKIAGFYGYGTTEIEVALERLSLFETAIAS